jgi:hypothetical protein
VEGEAKASAPSRTGTLKNAIRAYFLGEGRGVLEATATHAKYLHEGTGVYGPSRRPIVIKAKGKKAWYWPGARHPVKSVTQRGIRPRDFLRLAVKRYFADLHVRAASLAWAANQPLNVGEARESLRASFDPMFETLTVYDGSGIGVFAAYKAANNVTNPYGDPYTVSSHGPAPGGTHPVQPPVNTEGSVSFGPFFWPIGAVGPNNERLDIARQRGIGLHCGRTGYEDPTWGCIRMNDESCYDLFNLTRDYPLTEITIRP